MSALSSLLVRDRVVNVRTIEDALQRQVISGGDLETALLELGAIPEDTLAAYRAALVGGLAATRAELTRADPAAVALLPTEVALRHRLVPLRKEGARVVVAAADQPPADALGELSFLLGAQLDVRITTPFRLQWALAQRYGAELPARLRRLSDKLEQRDPGAVPRVAPLVGARRSVPPQRSTDAVTPMARASTTSAAPDAAARESRESLPTEDRVSASEVTGPLSDPDVSPEPAATTTAARPEPAVTALDEPTAAFAPKATVVDAPTEPSAEPATTAVDVAAVRPATEPSAEPAATAVDVAAVRPTTEPSAEPAAPSADVAEDDAERSSVVRTVEIRVIAAQDDPDQTAHDLPAVDAHATTGETLAGLPVPVADPRSQAPAPLGPRPPSEPAPPPVEVRPVAVSRVVPVRRAGEGIAQVPPTRDEIAAAFAATTDRDGVLETAFAMARRLVDYCALFVVQDDVAEGRDAAGPGADRETVSTIAVPLDAPGTLSDVRTSATIYFGPPSQDTTDEILQQQLDRPGVSPIVVLPVHIRGRMVLAIYGDCSGHAIPLDVNESAEQIAHEAADALTRIILMKKRESSRAPAARISSQPPSISLDGTPRVPLRTFAEPTPLPPAYTSDVPAGAEEHDTERPPPFADESTERHYAAPLMPRGLDSPTGHDTETDIEIVALSEDAAASLAATAREAEQRNTFDEPSGAYRLADGTREEVVFTPKPRTPVPPGHGRHASARDRSATPAGGYSMGSRGDAVAVDRVELPIDAQDATPRPSLTRTSRDEPSVIVDMGSNVAELVDALEREDGDRDRAIATLLTVGEAALPELVQRFPGRARPPDTRRGLPRPEDLGPIPMAIVAFRDRAVSYVESLLGHPDAECRFYAVAIAAEVLHPTLVIPLSERLLDLDDRVREIAVEVLRFASRHPEYQRALAYLRAVAGDDVGDALRRKHAIEAVGHLRDTGALDVLVRLVGSNDVPIAQAARASLTLLTRQDFGTHRRKWIAWADKHRNAHRVEWLIEALMHETPDLRRDASEELKRLTQEYFGYHFNQPAKERERAHRRYVLWWQDDGRRRFGAQR